MSLSIYLVSLLCAVILFTTAIARLNDMGRTTHNDWHWWLRRAGMILVAVGSAGIALSPILPRSWVAVAHLATLCGMTLSWLTTPSQPPWWKYISRGDQSNHGRRKDDP